MNSHGLWGWRTDLGLAPCTGSFITSKMAVPTVLGFSALQGGGIEGSRVVIVAVVTSCREAA